MDNSHRVSRNIVLLATCALPLTPVNASDFIQFGEEWLEIRGGAFLMNFDTLIEVANPAEDIGEEIDLEDALDYDDNDTTAVLGLKWRFAERHRLDIAYFKSKRDVDAVAADDIDLGGGEIIPAGAGFSSDFDIEIIPLTYSYSFTKGDNGEFYGSLGLHWFTIDYQVRGAAGLGSDSWSGEVVAEADAPMPLIGLGYDHYLNERWKLSFIGEAFYIELDEDPFSLEGGIINLGVSTEYFIWNRFAIGGSLNYFKLDVDVDDSKWVGGIEYEYWGPALYLKTRF